MTFEDVKHHDRVAEGYWFVPKLFGLGATPVTWQGWALTLGYVGGLMADIRWLPGLVPKIVVGIALTTAFTTVAWRKTEGGWHWRWGTK